MAKMAILSVQKTEQRLLRARTENLDNELIMETGARVIGYMRHSEEDMSPNDNSRICSVRSWKEHLIWRR